jgi:hypothetical protein
MKLFEANIKWGNANDDFSFDELPQEFLKAKELQASGNDECLSILLPFLTCLFLPENIFGDIEDVFELDEDEITCNKLLITALDFSQTNIPKVKATAYFELNLNSDFDFDELDEWQDENDMLDNGISFEWEIPTIDEDADVRSLGHEGLSFEVSNS